MMKSRPFFTVCIPAYKRIEFLPELLESILSQNFENYNILICEDNSEERHLIREKTKEYQTLYPGKIIYHENEKNLGYDANIRNLISLAGGVYCFFMGNDDIMNENSLEIAHAYIRNVGEIGVALRGYAIFDEDPSKWKQTIRYFNEPRVFDVGADTIATFFRRVGVISGFILNRDKAVTYATDRFDGGLYYQMYITASVLTELKGIAIPEILTLSRDGIEPDFGNSDNEKGVYTPGGITYTARINMLKSMIEIAAYIEREHGVLISKKIKKDMDCYLYPYIRDQYILPIKEYIMFFNELKRIGLLQSIRPKIYFFLTFIIRRKGMDFLIEMVRKVYGRSPHFGGLSQGAKIK